MLERKISHRVNLKARSIARSGEIYLLIVCFLAFSLIIPSRSAVHSQTTQQEEAQDQQFSALLAKAEADGQVRVILELREVGKVIALLDNQSFDQAIEQHQGAIANAQDVLLQDVADYVQLDSVRKFPYIPFMAMTVNVDGLKALRSSRYVGDIQENRKFLPATNESVPLIGAPGAWMRGYSGVGQTIAILDSGIDKFHPALAEKIVSEACYSRANGTGHVSLCPPLGPGLPPPTNSTAEGSGVNCDICKHGTVVAGVAAGNASTFSGVAKNATIISIQVFHKEGSELWANEEDILDGLTRVFQLRNDYKIAAVNLSVGTSTLYTENCDASYKAFKEMFDLLRSVGIAPVVSSGNDGRSDRISATACVSSAISVGSTDDGSSSGNISTMVDVVSDFSNSYPYLNLLAPGRFIYSSVPNGGYENGWWGTSFAAPHVAGAWAVLKSVKPQATVDEVLNTLVSTGKPITDSRNGVTRPRIQLDAAVEFIRAGRAWDLIIQDDRTGDVLLINSLTKEYQYIRCGQGGFMMSGRGEITRRGCLIRFSDGSRVTAVIDRCLIGPRNTGQVVIKSTPLGPTFFINDSNILNNSAICPMTPVPN